MVIQSETLIQNLTNQSPIRRLRGREVQTGLRSGYVLLFKQV